MFLMPGSRSKRRSQDSMLRLANSISSDVALSNTGLYFDGPSVAQGTRGAWFASGTVTLTDTAGAALLKVKLWDGVTIIDSVTTNTNAATQLNSVSVSGFISSPQGNIRISVNDASSVNGFIRANVSGNLKDSSISVIRIA